MNDCKVVRSCIGSKRYKYLDNREHISYAGQNAYKHLILSDGTLVIFHVSYNYKNCGETGSCADIFIDINGYDKGPNQFGKDFFMFNLKKDRIEPHGMPQEFPNFSSGCNTNNSYGSACTAWVIINENMDYLHCNDLGWNKKTKCK